MYEAFFQLTKKPFALTADPSFLFLTQQHSEALAGLVYAILGHKGLAMLTGDAGTGKTTLLATALHRVPASHLRSSVVLNPTLTASEFLESVLLDFGFTDIPGSKAQRIWLLQDLLLRSRRENTTVALIIDEAHVLRPELLEEIRLLGNFEKPDEKLLQIVLIGQPELGALLNQHALRQFKQRIAVRLSLEALSSADIRRYIEHRWSKAGGRTAPPFDNEAIELIALGSRGIPRLINSICDSALVTAFAESSAMVSVHQVSCALSDLDIPVHTARLNETRARAVVGLQPSGPTMNEDLPPPESRPRSDSFFERWAGRLKFVHQNGKS